MLSSSDCKLSADLQPAAFLVGCNLPFADVNAKRSRCNLVIGSSGARRVRVAAAGRQLQDRAWLGAACLAPRTHAEQRGAPSKAKLLSSGRGNQAGAGKQHSSRLCAGTWPWEWQRLSACRVYPCPRSKKPPCSKGSSAWDAAHSLSRLSWHWLWFLTS